MQFIGNGCIVSKSQLYIVNLLSRIVLTLLLTSVCCMSTMHKFITCLSKGYVLLIDVGIHLINQ